MPEVSRGARILMRLISRIGRKGIIMLWARLYDLLIKSAATTLDTLARDPKWLTHSAQPAITCVLHNGKRSPRCSARGEASSCWAI
jgi:hypothetical protein